MNIFDNYKEDIMLIFSNPGKKTLEEIQSLAIEKGFSLANGLDLIQWQDQIHSLQREGHAPSRICCLVPTKGGVSYPILVDGKLSFIDKKDVHKEHHFLLKEVK